MTSIKVFAAPEIVHVNDTDIIFDSDYYASNNLDIVAEFGTDRDALYIIILRMVNMKVDVHMRLRQNL